MKCRTCAVIALAVLLGLTLARSARAADTASIYDTLALMKDHTVLLVAVGEAKEERLLKTDGPYTLFAPTDAAFKALDDATIKTLATDREAVKQLLRSHLAPGKLLETDLKARDGGVVGTLHGSVFKVRAANDGLRVGDGKLVVKDITCRNGVIHVIDAVLPVAK